MIIWEGYAWVQMVNVGERSKRIELDSIGEKMVRSLFRWDVGDGTHLSRHRISWLWWIPKALKFHLVYKSLTSVEAGFLDGRVGAARSDSSSASAASSSSALAKLEWRE